MSGFLVTADAHECRLLRSMISTHNGPICASLPFRVSNWAIPRRPETFSMAPGQIELRADFEMINCAVEDSNAGYWKQHHRQRFVECLMSLRRKPA